jgi:hypothetical protein
MLHSDQHRKLRRKGESREVVKESDLRNDRDDASVEGHDDAMVVINVSVGSGDLGILLIGFVCGRCHSARRRSVGWAPSARSRSATTKSAASPVGVGARSRPELGRHSTCSGSAGDGTTGRGRMLEGSPTGWTVGRILGVLLNRHCHFHQLRGRSVGSWGLVENDRRSCLSRLVERNGVLPMRPKERLRGLSTRSIRITRPAGLRRVGGNQLSRRKHHLRSK